MLMFYFILAEMEKEKKDLIASAAEKEKLLKVCLGLLRVVLGAFGC
jgi:hypothetical protein